MKKILGLSFLISVLTGCVNQQETPPIPYNGGITFNSNQASQADENYCKSARAMFKQYVSEANKCFSKSIREKTEKNSESSDVITATYYTCSLEVSNLASSSLDITHCNMMDETGKSFDYFRRVSSISKSSSENQVRSTFYQKLVNEVLLRKKQLK